MAGPFGALLPFDPAALAAQERPDLTPRPVDPNQALRDELQRRVYGTAPVAPVDGQQSLTTYHPTMRDRLATAVLGDAPNPAAIDMTQRLLGSAGAGNSGFSAVDLTPAGVPMAVQEAARQGDAQGAALAIFAGPAARTADRAMLAKAQELAKAGTPREAIWKDTGWFQGADKKWRFEIDDSAAKLNPEVYQPGVMGGPIETPQSVSKQLLHDDLYDAYPNLRKINGMIETSGEKEPLRGFDNRGSGSFAQRSDAGGVDTIEVAAPNNAAGRSVALHELQHGVQAQEDFARGGSPSDRSLQGVAQELSQRGANRYADLDNEKRLWQLDWLKQKGIPENDPKFNRYMADASRDWHIENPAKSKAMDDAFRDMESKGARPIYERLAGEVEARNVQNRAHMTPEQRREIPPWTTQEYPDQRQVVRMWGQGPQLPEASAPRAPLSMLPMDEASRMARATDQGFGDKALRNTWAGKMLDDPEYGIRQDIKDRYKPMEREWYHGTQEAFDTFKTGGVKRQTSDWNTMLGPHFSDNPGVASQFAEGLYSRKTDGGNVIPAQLKIGNPKVYKSETDLSDDAVRWAIGKGILSPNDFAKGGRDTRELAASIKEGKIPDWAYGFGGEVLKGAGTKRKQIADGFRKELMDAGHDGIVYGNNVEGVATTAAIPMQTNQIRSRFAKFDPKNIGKAGLAGSVAAFGLMPNLEDR